MKNRLVPKRDDIDLGLEVVSKSFQPLRHIRNWISRKPLEIEAWFQRTTNRISKGHVTDDITCPRKVLTPIRVQRKTAGDAI